MSFLKIVAIADQHGLLPDIPECDLLIIAGDVTPVFDHDLAFQATWLRDNFAAWLKGLPAKHIVGIGGNHDYIFEKTDIGHELPWTYLQDSGTTVEGFKIYGYPWVPNLRFWAFYADREGLRKAASAIPEDTDILVTHGPPKGFGDRVSEKNHVGDSELLLAVRKVAPELHIFGHIHEANGEWKLRPSRLLNVALVDEYYEHDARRPVELVLPRKEES